MARPAYAARVQGKLAPPSFHEPAATYTLADSAPFLLDALWHFECVVSPRSSASGSLSPHSPAPASSRSQASPSFSCPSLSPLSRFTPSHQILQRVFSTFDENGDGTVSINEIARIFDRLGLPTSEYFLRSLLAGLDTKSQGHVDQDEFLQLYERVCSFVEEFDARPVDADVDEDLLAAFHMFDKDRNGFISPSELQTVLCSLGFPQARQLDACVDMIARVDENGDGQVDFLEFKKLFTDPIQSF
ncbi:hypothetical protein GOP47_0003438 [Adiantum capillus-veneris]|uniref:EF-hand domain-containing protein n=1 Tax=Adiantum capillus-veneris TaxID=13818 RepID=A0A9D4ZSJ2_ADICA|nr:hypothetical protein GOP47_0003438 [Adiantum capillus-veneris]